MDLRPLGSTGPRVSALGLGRMGISGVSGPADRAESIAAIQMRHSLQTAESHRV
jgi:aryl-alcohol dehydrogenase-like predicted oxidoreductase